MIEPTDTSRFRVNSTTACAAATIARIEALDATTAKFCQVRNWGLSVAKTALSRSRKTTTPPSRSRSARSAILRRARPTAALVEDMRRLRAAGGGAHNRLLRGVAPLNLRNDPPFCNNQNAIAHRQDFRQVGRDHQNRQTGLRQITDDLMNLRLASDIDAVGRLVQDEHCWRGREPAREGDLLAIAARKGGNDLIGASGAHAIGGDRFRRDLVFAAAIEQTEPS